MKKFLLFVFLFVSLNIFAQPVWQVNYSAYQYNMTMTGMVVIDYVKSTNPKDMVGAFINGECRGFASPVLNAADNLYYVDLVIYSNDYISPVTFKVYNADKQTTIDIEKGVTFEMNKIMGSTTKPCYWSSPTLSSDAKFTKFTIPGQIGETEITDSTVVLKFAADFILRDQVATFEVPEMTAVSIGTTAQVSGETHNNFTDTLIYKVVSADETSTTLYKVIAVPEKKPELDATNAITPNGDGVNDYWIIHNPEAYSDYELTIFTSNGMVVLSTTNYRNDWNGTYKGKTLSPGVYHYILKKGDQRYTGSISLIR